MPAKKNHSQFTAITVDVDFEFLFELWLEFWDEEILLAAETFPNPSVVEPEEAEELSEIEELWDEEDEAEVDNMD